MLMGKYVRVLRHSIHYTVRLAGDDPAIYGMSELILTLASLGHDLGRTLGLQVPNFRHHCEKSQFNIGKRLHAYFACVI